MKKLIIISLIILLSLSCTKNNSTVTSLFNNGSSFNIKRKVVYESFDSNLPLTIDEYEYNNDWNITKITNYGEDYEILYYYHEYFYNNDNQLNYRIYNHSNINSPSGFIVIDSTVFQYTNNNLVSETKHFQQVPHIDEIKYEYLNSDLYRKSYHHDNALEYYIIYEYNDSKLTKEKYYSSDDVLYQSIEHSYKDDEKNETKYFDASNVLIRTIEYYYDFNNRLIAEDHKEESIASSLAVCVIKYEYF